MIRQGRVLLVPLDRVEEGLLGALQWAILRAFRMPASIIDDFVMETDAGVPGFGPRLREAVGYLEASYGRDVQAAVLLTRHCLANGAVGEAMRAQAGPRIVLCPLAGFPDAASVSWAMVHTLGHAYSLGCCHSEGCVMQHWDACLCRDRLHAEPAFCQECRRALDDAAAHWDAGRTP